MNHPTRLGAMTRMQVIRLGQDHGWTVTHTRTLLTLRRSHTLTTPQRALHAGLWTEPSYRRDEHLTFFFGPAASTPGRYVRGRVTHRIARAPWVAATHAYLAHPRALGILTSPAPSGTTVSAAASQ